MPCLGIPVTSMEPQYPATHLYKQIGNGPKKSCQISSETKLLFMLIQCHQYAGNVKVAYACSTEIVYGLIAIEMPHYIVHPFRMSRLSHPLAYWQLYFRHDYHKYSFFWLAVVQWNNRPANTV